MNDTYNQIQRRKKLYRYGLLLLFLALVVLAVPTYSIYSRAKLAVDNGYDRRLYRSDYDPVVFFAKCYTTRVCPDALKAYLVRTPLIPLRWWGYLSLGLATGAFAFVAAARAVRDDREPGVAHWATKSELKEKGYFNGLGYLGVSRGEKLSYPADTLFSTTLVLGNPGSGKTRSVLEPMIVEVIRQGMSVVVIDQKFPNVNGFPKYFEWIERETDAKIEVLLLNEPNSPTISLLEIAKEYEGAQYLTRLVYPQVDPKDTLAHHFTRERPHLALVLHLEARFGEGSIGNVYDTFAQGVEHYTNFLNEAYAKGQISKREYNNLQAFFELSKMEKAKIVSAITGRLEPFGNPLAGKIFRYSERSVNLYEITKRQTVFYVAVDPTMVASGVSRTALQAVLRAVIFAARKDIHENAGKATVPLVLFLDEFPSLGYIPELTEDIRTLREAGVGYVFATQNLAAIQEAYEDHPIQYKALIASVGHHILTHKTSPEDVMELAEHIGKTSSRKYSHSTSSDLIGRPLDAKKAVRTELEGDNLIRPDEFRLLNIGRAIILSQETFPILAEFPLLDNLEKPDAGQHPATERIFRRVRNLLPRPPRTANDLSLWLAPYVFDPRIDGALTQRPSPGFPTTASEPPASLNAAAVPSAPSASQNVAPPTATEKASAPAVAPAPAPPTSAPKPTAEDSPPEHEPATDPETGLEVDPVSALNNWVQGLDESPVACRLIIGNSLEPSTARLASLLEHPLPLPDPEALASLEDAKYIKRLSDTQLEITRVGYAKLEEPSRDILARHAMLTVLIAWIEENAAHVIGHPSYTADGAVEPKAQLTPDGHLVILRTALSEEVLKGASPNPDYLAKIRVNPDEDVRLTTKKSRRRAYRIPLPRGLYSVTERPNGEASES